MWVVSKCGNEGLNADLSRCRREVYEESLNYSYRGNLYMTRRITKHRFHHI